VHVAGDGGIPVMYMMSRMIPQQCLPMSVQSNGYQCQYRAMSTNIYTTMLRMSVQSNVYTTMSTNVSTQQCLPMSTQQCLPMSVQSNIYQANTNIYQANTNV
jgi:hypothetical protein